MTITVPTTTSMIATSTKTTIDYTFLSIILNSKTLSAIVWAAAFVLTLYLFKDVLGKFLTERLKKINLKGKDKEATLEIFDKKDSEDKGQLKETEAPPIKGLDSVEENKPVWEDPKSIEDWEMQRLFALVFDKDTKKAEKAHEKVLELETDPLKRKLQKLAYLRDLYCHMGDENAKIKLESMKDESDVSGAVHQSLGLCHERGENFREAFGEFILASKFFKNDKERINAKIYAARNSFKVEGLESSVGLLAEELKTLSDENLKAEIYEGLAEVYNLEKNKQFQAILLEKVLKIKPSDKDLLFKAGYLTSELNQGFNYLSFLHYKNALKFGSEEESVTNNLGVQYERLGMSIKSIATYKQSVEKGGTLAAANLAYSYLNAGFKKEAEDTLNEAKKKENPHKNVSEATAALLGNLEKEDEKEKEVLENARKQQDFLAKFAERYFVPVEPRDYSGEWKFEDGIKVSIEQKENLKIVATWFREGKRKFEGELRNRGAKILNYKMLYSRYFTKPDDEILYDEDGYGFVFIESGSKETIKIMNIKDEKFVFYSLTRLV